MATRPSSSIVVGGGVVGLCAGLCLQRAGVDVTILERGGPRPASWGNAGHLATEHVEPLASPKTLRGLRRRVFALGGALDFVWKDVACWAPWAMRFLAASGPGQFRRGVDLVESLTGDSIPAWCRLLGNAAEGLILENGHWVLWQGRDPGARALAQMAGVRTGRAEWRPLSASERAALTGKLNGKDFDGVRFQGTGQVSDPERVLEVLTDQFTAAGGVFKAGRADQIVRDGGRLRVIGNGGLDITADTVLVASGAWSKALLESAGLKAPLIAERGYHIGFQNPDWPEALSPVVFEDRSVVMSKFAPGMRATSFVEFGRAESAPDPAKWRRLERHMRDVGVLKDGPVTRWMGARPTLPDYLPAIGGGEVQGLYYAIGHAHLGLTLAALTGELVRDLILGAPTSVDLAPFSLARFRQGRPS